MSGKKKQLGALAAAISAILYGVVPVIVSVAYENGFHFASALTFQCTFSLPPLLLFFRLSRKGGEEKLRLAPGEGRKVLIAALAGMVLATALLYASYSYISAGIATTIHFIYPILVNVGCLFVFREPLTSVLLDVAFVGSAFTGRIAVSCACILTGVVCTSVSTFCLEMEQK